MTHTEPLFERNDPRHLYWLIDSYLNNEIDGWEFHNEFYYSYSLEVPSGELTESERSIFAELTLVVDRYTNVPEDLIQYPGVYSSDERLKKSVIRAQELLRLNKENRFIPQ